MKTLIQLTHLQYKLLVSQKSFLYTALVLGVFALFMIPNADSEYMTFSIAEMTGYPDSFWVSSLGAVLINLSLSFIAFFFLEGNRKIELESGVGALIRVSTISNQVLIFVKWVAYTLVICTLVLIGLLCLFIVNFKGFNPLDFLKAFFYFNLPFTLFLSSLILMFDYGLSSRVIKITCFIFLITALGIANTNEALDVMGLNEFKDTMSQQVVEEKRLDNYSFNIGFMPKLKEFTYHNFKAVSWIKNWPYKLGLSCSGLFLILLFSLVFRRYKLSARSSFLAFLETKDPIQKIASLSSPDLRGGDLKNSAIGFNYLNLARVNFLVFKSSFTRLKLISFLCLWIGSFFVEGQLLTYFFVPLLFLFGFNLLEKLVGLVNKEEVKVYFTIGIHNRLSYASVAFFFLCLFFIFCGLPVLYSMDLPAIVLSVLKFILLSAMLVGGITFSRVLKAWEISYLIIFGTYIAGSPIWVLF